MLHSPEEGLTMPLMSASAPTLYIQSLQLPDYLMQRNLVLQTSPVNIHFALPHVWAMPFERDFTQTLTTHLSQQGIKVITSLPADNENTISLQIFINDFIPTYNGTIILTGSYIMTTGQSLPTEFAYAFESQLEQDGFKHTVSKMQELTASLSLQIANNITP
jgi:uncharacterized lipoprotein YmbA